ncbi:MAG: glycosyltransferase [Anaerolineae bacterium]|jgi:glycosyltransferase involved in cell wall biosynthesis|nr:glycosyltransferase [Anaerolineae bacterium]
MKPTILAISDYYAPAVKAGGGHLAIRNMVRHLSDEFDFRILTADCDLGETQPYPNILYGEWASIDTAQVRYLSQSERKMGALAQIINSIPHDMIYLNTFFGMMAVKTIALRKLNRIRNKNILVGVHGEFYPQAIGYKHLKKQVYLVATKAVQMYNELLWHATNAEEATQIAQHLGVHQNRVKIASVLPAPLTDLPTPSHKQANELRMIYLSRITPKKNLAGALELLMKVKVPVQFDIYGTQEDMPYWDKCQDVIRQMPSHIQVRYCGAVTEQQIELFNQYHLFLFPTFGENFGYVIQESLLGGCLPLISTETPWRGLADKNAGWDIPLSSPEEWIRIIEAVYAMDNDTFSQWSQHAQAYGIQIAHDTNRIQANRDLFRFALKGLS